MFNKVLKDEQGSVTAWIVGLFILCGILFGWLPHVIMSKNHMAAMNTFDIFNSPHFGENFLTALPFLIILVPAGAFGIFILIANFFEHQDAKLEPLRKEAEERSKKWMEEEKFENVVARYLVQKELEHPSSIVEKPGTTSINKYRAERQK